MSAASWTAIIRSIGTWAGRGVGLVIAWRGVAHALEPALFAQRMDAYGVVDPAWVAFLSRWVAWTMVGSGALAGLGWGAWQRAGSWAVVGILALFLAAMAVAWALGHAETCGCFDDGAGMAWGMLRTALLFGMVVLALRLARPVAHA